ncbi:MAG: iron ABC transporter permease, partial [Rhodocyclaceae bacterium]|nr:iron ABC transporter permease [Rhodocyclaceae bacterium]
MLPVALLTLIPLAVVLASFLRPQPEVWAHLTAYVLPDVVKNSLLLACGVGTGVFALGVSLAWLTAQCDFPGRRVFAWALMLPLAMPAYVLAFVQVGLFEYTGPVQTAWRALGGNPAWMPQVRSLPGAVVVLSLAFYPYVYLLAREAFLSQGRRALEAAQTLGYSRRAAFWRLALPMARPWIAGGLVLALMETLADFGAVSIFNLDTFTTAIYKAWFALFNLNAAAQLASLLALAVLALAAGEQWARGRRQYHVRAAGSARHALSGAARAAASIYCAGVLGLAFVLPLLQLLAWAGANWQNDLDARYAGFVWHSIVLAASAALCVAACALVLAQARRAHPDPLTTWLVRLSTLGYALPGAVLAVGVFVPVAWLDGWLVPLAQHWGLQGWQVASGTLVVMLAALTAR